MFLFKLRYFEEKNTEDTHIHITYRERGLLPCYPFHAEIASLFFYIF